jgi:hypothetical protein
MKRVLMSLFVVVCAMSLAALAQDAMDELQVTDDAAVVEVESAVEDVVVEPAAEVAVDVEAAVEEEAVVVPACEMAADKAGCVEAVEEAADEAGVVVEDAETVVVPEEVPAE